MTRTYWYYDIPNVCLVGNSSCVYDPFSNEKRVCNSDALSIFSAKKSSFHSTELFSSFVIKAGMINQTDTAHSATLIPALVQPPFLTKSDVWNVRYEILRR